jgi:subtilase family serine protease
LDATDVSLGYRVVPPLAAGAESRADTRLPLPRGLSTGRYYLLGKIDSSGAVAESDETNNVALAPDPLDLRLEAPRGKLREGFDAR